MSKSEKGKPERHAPAYLREAFDRYVSLSVQGKAPKVMVVEGERISARHLVCKLLRCTDILPEVRSANLLIALALGLGLSLALLWILSSRSALATTTPAAESHACSGGCASPSIRAAVDLTSGGNFIKVPAHTYTETHQPDRIAQLVYMRETGTRQGDHGPDMALRSGASASMSDQHGIPSGPDDQIRVIVQMHDDPVAMYVNRMLGSNDRTRLVPLEIAAIQQYADNLAIIRGQLLANIGRQGIQVQVNREFGYLFNGLALSIKKRDWQYLEQMPQVKAIYLDYQLKVTLSDSVPLIGAPSVWAMTDGEGQAVAGQGIRVAVLDSGIDYTHPDLGGGFGPGYKVIDGHDFVNGDADPADDNGHGTHVAGILAASGTVTGVAPSATLLAYKVCGAGGSCNQSTVIAGLERAADPDGNPGTDDAAHVVNMSLGGQGSPDDALSQAVDNAVDQGMVVVVSAGNEGPGYMTVSSPGVARKALAVAASDKSDHLADFSSRGPVREIHDILKPDITAPGVAILSTYPMSQHVSFQGTSMAAPHVAGAVALLRQLRPDWTPSMLKANLMNTAADLGLVVYEQGAGRVRLEEATTTPLVATPGSLAFGLPLIDGATSAQLALVNVSTTTVTATVSISTVLWAKEGPAPLTYTLPVTYATLSDYTVTIAASATKILTVSLNIPDDALEGYYTGKITLRGAGYTVTVPFVFTLLSKVTVHMLNENGVELFSGSEYVVAARLPDADVFEERVWENLLPTTFHLPSGTYNIHGFARTGYYWYLMGSGAEEKPLILATTATISPNVAVDVYLNGATANRFVLDATTFSGDPLYIGGWLSDFRYQNDGKAYRVSYGTGYGDFRNTHFFKPFPPSLEFYISDTPEHVGLIFRYTGYGYSPRQRHFWEQNWTKWYEGPDDDAGYIVMQHADEVHFVEWRYPKIDASTSVTFTHIREQVGEYRVRYDHLGVIDRPSLLGNSFASSADAFPGDWIRPISAGWERSFYVNRPVEYRYFVGKFFDELVSELELGLRDWTKAYTATTDSNLQLIRSWELHPLPLRDASLTLGAGPLYPAATFSNTTSIIRLIHPVFASGAGVKQAWDSDPVLTVYKDDSKVYSVVLREHWWSPPPLRRIPASGAGDYRVLITSDFESQISYNNRVEAGFALPAADMTPPHITAFEMPQRFSPNEIITGTLVASDTKSGVNDLEMQYSLNGGTSWIPATLVDTLVLPQEGTVYTTTINPTGALSVSLAYTVTDIAGNYLAFTSLGAAIRETPVTLTLDVTPTVVSVSSQPFTMTLSGTLRKGDDEPLSRAALPIAIYLNDHLGGYVRDVARLEDGTFLSGTIGFDWTFIPTDFVTEPGTAELRFVFDLGTYARQEEVFTITVVAPPTGVSIAGPATGVVSVDDTFVATVSPSTAAPPITYTWQIEEQNVIERTGGLSDTVTFQWNDAGTYTIAVTATNVFGTVASTHEITVSHKVYLPLVVRYR